ncbi:hypothetical protein BG74_04675 [Sodalis-like endosymbiont of Proechinophthirus fluctus]|nr:hypothetical protein BG74_04675 [Sodalis-like endosymbiont of Proechinophthirus fluctus]
MLAEDYTIAVSLMRYVEQVIAGLHSLEDFVFHAKLFEDRRHGDLKLCEIAAHAGSQWARLFRRLKSFTALI